MTVRTRLEKSLISHIICFQVSAIYKDPSLDSNLRLVIVRMIFFEEEQEGQVHATRSVFRFSNFGFNIWTLTTPLLYVILDAPKKATISNAFIVLS